MFSALRPFLIALLTGLVIFVTGFRQTQEAFAFSFPGGGNDETLQEVVDEAGTTGGHALATEQAAQRLQARPARFNAPAQAFSPRRRAPLPCRPAFVLARFHHAPWGRSPPLPA